MSGERINVDENVFDIMRVICAVIIYLGHFLTHFEIENGVLTWIAYIVRGVPVFFFLSGFFCARSIEKYTTGEFLKKRFFRIYPALWVCLIINTIIVLGTYDVVPSLKELVIYVGTQFTIFQFYTGDWLRGYGAGAPNGALWTISTEVQFYLVLAVLAPLLRKLTAGFKEKNAENIEKNRVRAGAWGGVIALLALTDWVFGQFADKLPGIINKFLSVSAVPFLYIFLFGVLCYLYRDKVIPLFKKWWKLLMIIYILWSFVPEEFSSRLNGVRYNVLTTFMLMIWVIGIGYSFGKHRLKHEISYHFYLYHMVVINVFVHNFFGGSVSVLQGVIYFVLIFVLILLFAVFSERVVDGIVVKKLVTRWRKSS